MSDAGARDRRYWERHAPRYDQLTRVFRRPMAAMTALVGEAARGAGRVLEVGAGTGQVTVTLARVAKSVVATDYAAPMVELLAKRLRVLRADNVTCEQADLYQLPYADGAFDVVVAANVLHLVPDLPAALAALRRVLAPVGLLVAPTFLHDETALSWTLSRLFAVTGFPGHRRFSARSLRRALEDAGLEVGRTATIPGLFPIGYVDGWFGR